MTLYHDSGYRHARVTWANVKGPAYYAPVHRAYYFGEKWEHLYGIAAYFKRIYSNAAVSSLAMSNSPLLSYIRKNP